MDPRGFLRKVLLCLAVTDNKAWGRSLWGVNARGKRGRGGGARHGSGVLLNMAQIH